ncbi:MAG: hypothetical protein WCY36_03175 [Candidatus Omnitrophota bacterium]
MIAVKNMARIFKNEGYRVFFIAIIASFLWHIFCLSAVKIVSRADSVQPVKFSKVSFLGPFLGKGGMDLQVRPKERAFLEKRFLEAFNSLPELPASGTTPAIGLFESDKGVHRFRDETMTMLIDESLGSDKPELVYEEE